MRALEALLILAVLSGCATPEPLTETTAEGISRLASGPASSDNKTNNVKPSVAASYLGDVDNAPFEVTGATVSRQNTSSGNLLTGFSAGTIKNYQEAVKEAREGSATLQALQSQLARLNAAETPDEALIASTIASISAEEARISNDLLRSAGGDMSSLTHWVQVFTNFSPTGYDGAASDAAIKAVADGLSNTVREAAGANK